MEYRQIAIEDIPDLFAVRTATHENRLSNDELAEMGITQESVRQKLFGTYHGWLCEIDQLVVGFAIGDRSSGELWVIAVLPEFIGKGIGSKLLGLVENLLQENGCTRLWLTTDIDPNLKAYTFYRKHGWIDDSIEGDLRYMQKKLRAKSIGTNSQPEGEIIQEDTP